MATQLHHATGLAKIIDVCSFLALDIWYTLSPKETISYLNLHKSWCYSLPWLLAVQNRMKFPLVYDIIILSYSLYTI